MIPYDFSPTGEKELLALPVQIQRRILRKIEFYLSAPDHLKFAKRLTETSRPTWRFQVNDYRVIFEQESGHIIITRVGHRGDIYRKL